MKAMGQTGSEATGYNLEAVVDLLGKKVHILELSHEISPTIPVYPGHQKIAFWKHLTHAESRMRLPADSDFCGYSVTGLALCDHVSTHMDSVSHFNESRPDLSVDTVPFRTMITPGVWIDLSFVPPRSHIKLKDVKQALAAAGIDAIPRGCTFLYWTGSENNWGDPLKCVTEYPGLDSEASNWILDQGVVNVCTDAPSLDNPADLYYPNHKAHGKRLVVHTELIANITRIPRHEGFYVIMLPLKLEGSTGSPIRAIALWED
ncbi:MAG: cyclase family protein [Chloroflexi bacterium]|nr:cyclase family protein [Chloroflexota bacterium]